MPVKPRLLFLLISGMVICCCFPQGNIHDDFNERYKEADSYYKKAEQISADDTKEAEADSLNALALASFRKLISNPNAHFHDSLLFHCYVKSGTLFQYFDSLPSLAKSCYTDALALKDKLPSLQDSFLFKPLLFAGSIFYGQSQYDSAVLNYKKAELILNKYNHPLEDGERLYNTMGAMLYETGNYRSANNYFQKAIALLNPANPSFDNLLVNFQMNIASSLIKLEEYGRADTILQKILPYKVNLNEIHHNLGIIGLRLGNYNQAMQHFRKVDYQNNPKVIELYFNMATVFSSLSQRDSSRKYINMAIAENNHFNGTRKNTSMGLALKFIADEMLVKSDPDSAVVYYQRAIQQFYPGFGNTDIYSAPDKFSGVFSYINLFNTLIAKGDAFSALYKKNKQQKYLEAAFQSYRSAFTLADYVARSYDSDEARFFLNKIKYISHDKAISSSLALYELTGAAQYMEEAYFFDQRNKASALTLSLQEGRMKKEAGIPDSLSEKQSSLRSAITRLSIKASRVTDSAALSAINNEIRDNEIRLSVIQEKINSNPKYASLDPSVQIPSVKKLQDILDGETCLLSYHLSDKELLVFCISSDHFSYVRQPTDSSFQQSTRAIISNLHNMDQASRYNGSMAAQQLYKLLIQPLLPSIGKASRLIIIPDDELNYLPFEALEDSNKKYLLQNYAIQYQYSTALLQLPEIKETAGENSRSLGFAPFSNYQGEAHFLSLPNSKEEISALKGKLFFDSAATKQRFIENANSFPMVQLATHAAADDESPAKSYIAFFPSKKDSADQYILFASEIYNLRLDSLRLIILSACETGNGALVRGEGLMSITRAFAYAGCPNIITSLWQAADKTTAYLTTRLHFYLDKGYSKDKALQQAKIDLLNNNDISPSLKTPNYWAHLVFIGNYEPEKKGFNWWWLIAGIAIPVIILQLWRKKENNPVSGCKP